MKDSVCYSYPTRFLYLSQVYCLSWECWKWGKLEGLTSVRIPSIWRRYRGAIISIILGSSLRCSTSSASQVKLLQPKFVNGCPEVLFAEEWMEIYGGDGMEWITSIAICSHCYAIPLRPNCYVISVGCSVMFVPSYPLVTQKQAGGVRRKEWI